MVLVIQTIKISNLGQKLIAIYIIKNLDYVKNMIELFGRF
jgi:hypothetical protein